MRRRAPRGVGARSYPRRTRGSAPTQHGPRARARRHRYRRGPDRRAPGVRVGESAAACAGAAPLPSVRLSLAHSAAAGECGSRATGRGGGGAGSGRRGPRCGLRRTRPPSRPGLASRLGGRAPRAKEAAGRGAGGRGVRYGGTGAAETLEAREPKNKGDGRRSAGQPRGGPRVAFRATIRTPESLCCPSSLRPHPAPPRRTACPRRSSQAAFVAPL